jgi:HK97 family phage portal protein
MKGMKRGAYFVDGSQEVKASILWDEETDAWNYSSNPPTQKAAMLYRTIPTLFRGVTIIGDTVTKVPFAVYRGDEEVDTSSSWENKAGYFPNPRKAIKLTSQALDRHGRAYWLKAKNRGGVVKELKWLTPTSITPIFSQTTGELEKFERSTADGRTIVYKPDDIVYFWLEDPDVEQGPPLSWPCKSAEQAAGVLHNLDEFINTYFKSGAIRPAMLLAKGFPPEEEKERVENWFKSMMTGIRNARRAKVFSADSIEYQQIGDGLDQLQNQELTEDQRKDVSLALGIPQTILFANSANYATSQTDWLNFHEVTIIPRCEFIAEVFNDQLLKADGLEMRFTPEGLDIYREDENARASALVQYVNAGYPLLMASDLLGIDLTPEQRAELEAAEAEKEERADEMAENMQQKPEEGEQEPMTEEAKAEANHWRRICNKALREGKSLPVDFVCEHIPAAMAAKIAEALQSVTDGAGVKAAFEQQPAPIPLPADWPLPADLLAELKRANDLLESVKG